MTKFQLILTGVFGFFVLAGVLVFALARPGAGEKAIVTVWGSITQNNMSDVISSLPISKNGQIQIMYKYIKDTEFDQVFIEALASGTGPDIVILPQDSLLKHKDKLVPVPFESYSERDFKNTFIEEGELFLDTKGIYAFPIIVDPLVLYWNRDIFTNQSIAEPPKYWDETYELSRNLTKKDGALNITQATLPFGEYSNITNAKEIISALMLQAGSPIVSRLTTGGYTSAIMNASGANELIPSVLALNFYTEFSNAAKPHYTWNRSLQNSQTLFLAGDLAMYPGFASEYNFLKLKNPNLNFDVSLLPQSRGTSRNTTFGRIQGLSVVRSTKNSGAAFTVISALVSKDAAKIFSEKLALPPARRDLLAEKQTSANGAVFYQSALWSRAWADPDKSATGNMFQDMVESITSGRERPIQAITRINAELSNLLMGK